MGGSCTRLLNGSGEDFEKTWATTGFDKEFKKEEEHNADDDNAASRAPAAPTDVSAPLPTELSEGSAARKAEKRRSLSLMSILNGTGEEYESSWATTGFDKEFKEGANNAHADAQAPARAPAEEPTKVALPEASAPTPAFVRNQSSKMLREGFVEHTPMRVMPWLDFKEQGCCLRSDVAKAKELLQTFDAEMHTAIFVSHKWWVTAAQEDRTIELAVDLAEATPDGEPSSSPTKFAFDTGRPDWTTGEKANLKFRVLCMGLEGLIQRFGLDQSRLALWMDWFSIDQDDPELKSKGVASLIRYTTKCSYMLVPLDRPLAEAKIVFPEQIPEYGGRAWCRLEYFCFSCLSEMSGASEHGVQLWTCGTRGQLKQFPEVNVEGGKHNDMPSQGQLTLESDRSTIRMLEDQMIGAFGHQVIRNALEAGVPPVLHLTGKLLRDEHMGTLVELLGGGGGGGGGGGAGELQEGSFRCCEELHLRNNQIGDAGCVSLAGCEGGFGALRYLSLSSNCIGEAGVQAIADVIRRGAWPRLSQLYIGGNPLGAGAAELKKMCAERGIDTPFLA
jgi:hypothetical protein